MDQARILNVSSMTSEKTESNNNHVNSVLKRTRKVSLAAQKDKQSGASDT